MSRDFKSNIKYCVYCGTNVEENKIYCPSCGKLTIKIKPGKKITTPISELETEISRKCSGCNSIITSIVLEQCPICDTPLEKLSEIKKASIQKKPGLIFMDKKLQLEEKFILNKETWNLKEGFNVFGTCIFLLMIVFFSLFTIISFQSDSTVIEVKIENIVLSQIPELLFGLYPIWYIYKKKHSYNKLGFYSGSRKILLAVLVGVIGTIALLLINYLSNSLISFISDLGLDFFDVAASISEQNEIIENTDFLWVLLLTVLLISGGISAEIVFRGVLHNTLKQRFQNRYFVVLTIALIYSVIMLLFSFPMGLILFLPNFLTFTVLGILYEINGNIYNTIMASIFYNVIIIIVFFL